MNAQAADSATQIVTGTDGPILVVLQQAGGNDGLNMLPPWADDAYHRARPTLGIAADKSLKLDDYCGLHPSLSPLKALYDEGNMAVVQGVGYPEPQPLALPLDRNLADGRRFRPQHALRLAGPVLRPLLPGRAADGGRVHRRADAAGVQLAAPDGRVVRQPGTVPLDRPAMRHRSAAASADALFPADQRTRRCDSVGRRGQWSIGSINAGGAAHAGDLGSLDFLERTALDAQLSSDKVLEIARKTQSQASYPNNKLADSLSLVARMIAGGLPTRVYYVSHGGYDTHQRQAPTHERLMKEFGDGARARSART